MTLSSLGLSGGGAILRTLVGVTRAGIMDMTTMGDRYLYRATSAQYAILEEAVANAYAPGTGMYVARGDYSGPGRTWVTRPVLACVISHVAAGVGITLERIASWDVPRVSSTPEGEFFGKPSASGLVTMGLAPELGDFDVALLMKLQHHWDRNVTSIGGWGLGRSVAEGNRAGMRDVLRRVERT